MLLYAPGWSLASQFWSYPPPNVSFSAAKKMKIPQHWKRDARATLTFEKKISETQHFLFCFFGCFCRRFRHADVDSRAQQAIPLKTVENFSPKLRFSCFSCEKCGTILSRRSRLSSRAPSRLIRPRLIDCDGGPKQTMKTSRFLANSVFEHRIQKKVFHERSTI